MKKLYTFSCAFPLRRFNSKFLLTTSLFVSIFLLSTIQSFAQPDLQVSSTVIANTLRVDYLNNNDQCFINEGCVGGTGARQLLRFTTEIANIGDTDFYVGRPPSSPANSNDQWEWDECHDHWHYEGYARYVIKDASGNELPSSFKNGFCLMDITCSTGTAKYNCNNQGITAGCADIYSSGLDCQWVDVTDLPPGDYELRVEVNWDQTADALGNVESNYDNNTGVVCFTLTRAGDQVFASIIDCSTLGNNGGGTNGTCAETEYKLRFTFDNYPEETTYSIQDDQGNQVAIGGPYGANPDGSTLEESICLVDGCYTLTVNDSYGDGICCGYGQGKYELIDNNNNIVASGAEFSNNDSKDFCVQGSNSGGGTTPSPTCLDYALEFTFDNYPEETTFRIVNGAGATVASGGPYGNFADGSNHTENFCLADGCYDVIIEDTYGDGICCGYGQGSFRLKNDTGETILSGGQFNSSYTGNFCIEIDNTNPENEGPCPGNVLPDPGFESSLTGWEIQGRITRNYGEYTGTRAVKLTGEDAQLMYTVNAGPGAEIDFCGYLKIRRSPIAAMIGISWLDDNFQIISSETTSVTTRDYEEYCVSGTAPPGTNFASLFLYHNGQNNAKLIADDLCAEGTISNRSSSNSNRLDISLRKSDRTVLINWATNTNQYVKSYWIEKSTDNINFEILENYPVNDKNEVMMQYEIMDTEPSLGTNYYRIKQVLIGDVTIQSPTRRVEFDFDIRETVLFPNPTSDFISVDLRPVANESGTIQIVDNYGRLLSSTYYESIPDTPQQFDIKEYASGMYQMVLMIDGQRIFTKSFVINKE